MAGCPLTIDSAFDCSSKTQGGIYTKLLLYNLTDWKLNTVTKASNAITNIVNGSTIQAYDFSVADAGNLMPNASKRAVSGGIDGFDHQIDSKLYLHTQVALDNISNLRFNKVVAILLKLDGTGLLYGEGVGMRLSDFQYLPGDAATGGLAQFVLKTNDVDPPENELPVVIFKTDAATTKTLIDGLTTPGA